MILLIQLHRDHQTGYAQQHNHSPKQAKQRTSSPKLRQRSTCKHTQGHRAANNEQAKGKNPTVQVSGNHLLKKSRIPDVNASFE